ncbi:MAG: class I lanthipeptide [Mariniphaga sp.]|nr:class I lanthipeptide [Mariniphaga sp.]
MEKKKLELKKQTIVTLTDQECLEIKGGTHWTRIVYGAATLIVAGAYYGQEMSYWYCDDNLANTDLTCFELYGGCNVGEIIVTP